ncbi:hypothetical protein ACLB2K_033413 [Fragaria x ananassa]
MSNGEEEGEKSVDLHASVVPIMAEPYDDNTFFLGQNGLVDGPSRVQLALLASTKAESITVHDLKPSLFTNSEEISRRLTTFPRVHEDHSLFRHAYIELVLQWEGKKRNPNPKAAVLLVIDMQNYFSAMAKPILQNLQTTIRLCRRVSIPVIFTRHCHKSPSDYGMLDEWWNGDLILDGTPESQLIPELDDVRAGHQDHVVEKNTYSAFRGTGLEEYLKERDIQEVIVTGVMTNLCCETTAREAKRNPNPKAAVLLVIDMQNYFSILAKPILQNLLTTIRLCRRASIPVIFARHCQKSPSDYGMLDEWWNGDLILDGTPESQLMPELDDVRAHQDHVVDKNTYSAFRGTGLEEYLKERGIEEVIVTGVMTNLCCETTARDAFVRGFRVFFSTDATATENEELQEATLKNLAYGFAYLVDCSTFDQLPFH